MQTVVSETVAPGVACLTLNRPAHLNALNDEMFDDFTSALTEVSEDPEVKAIILTGAGRGFCAGHDLDDVVEIMKETPEQRIRRIDREVEGLVRIRTMSTPIIAAVNGVAIGGGMSLAALCDMRIASTTATMGVGFINIGLSSGDAGLSWTLPRIVGSGLAADLMFTGRVLDAAEALAAGFVSRVAEPADLVVTAISMASAIAQHEVLPLRLTKRALNASATSSFADALAAENTSQVIAMDTPEARERYTEFLSRRAR